MDKPEETVFTVTNDGEADFCLIDGTIQVYLGRKIIKTETVTINGLKVGEKTEVKFVADPVELGLDAGETYRVKLTLKGHVYEGDECSQNTIDPVEHIAERSLCEDVKPVISVINLNAECIDAGDTLKFKGMIDIDTHSSANRIIVQTGKIFWGGTSYDCEIVSVKKSVNTEFTDIPADQRGTSYEFEDFGHGAGAIGFVCEAKTAENDQKRSGQTLSFNASAVVKPAGNAAEYRIESNTVTGSQQCVYTHTTQLPYTGDDTNMPVLIGLFSLFVICGGASSFVILRKKKADIGEAEPKE